MQNIISGLITRKKQIIFFLFLLLNVFFETNAQNSFKSIWTPVSKLYKEQTRDINFDSSGNMFICGDKMYISKDTGKTGDIYFDKAVNRTFISPNNYVYASTNEGLYRRKNFESDWEKITDIVTWAVAFGNDGKILIGSQEGLFYSYNDSDWTQVADFGLDSVGVTGFGVDSAGSIYAGGFYRESSPYVIPFACIFRSRDNGLTWQKLSFPDSMNSSAFTSQIIATKDKKIIYNIDEGTFISNDDGETWQNLAVYYYHPQFGLHQEYFHRLYLFNNDIYALSSSRLWLSTDSGSSWDILFNGDNFGLGLFCFGIAKSGQHFLGTTGGLSLNNGQTWEQTLNVNTTIPALYLSFGWNGEFFAGTENGVYISKYKGESWQQSGLKGVRVIGIDKSPKGSILVSSFDSVLYISRDTSKSWEKIGIDSVCTNLPFAGLIAVDSTGNFFYTYENILFKSSDDGKTWTKILENSKHTFLSILITKEQKIFTILDTGKIIQSGDAGLSWSNADNGIPPWTVPVRLVECGNYLFTVDGGIYRTSKDEINWELVGLKYNYNIENLIADSKENLYAFIYLNDGTGKKGIYRSGDLGRTWEQIDFTSSDNLVFLEFDDDYFYAVTSDGNIVKSKSPVTSIKDNRDILPRSYLLSQNYPNPFNPSTRIIYELPVESKVVIKIYDILGCEAATLLNETRNAGRYEVLWNASNYASGVYFYSFKAIPINSPGKEFYMTKKLILLK